MAQGNFPWTRTGGALAPKSFFRATFSKQKFKGTTALALAQRRIHEVHVSEKNVLKQKPWPGMQSPEAHPSLGGFPAQMKYYKKSFKINPTFQTAGHG